MFKLLFCFSLLDFPHFPDSAGVVGAMYPVDTSVFRIPGWKPERDTPGIKL